MSQWPLRKQFSAIQADTEWCCAARRKEMCTKHKYFSVHILALWIIQNYNVTALNTVQTCRIVFLFLKTMGGVGYLDIYCLVLLWQPFWLEKVSLLSGYGREWCPWACVTYTYQTAFVSYCTAVIWSPPLSSIASLQQSLQRYWSRRRGFVFPPLLRLSLIFLSLRLNICTS